MIPVIDDFIQSFSLTDFVIVADSGLMNKKNVELLRKAGCKYITGARIKNENRDVCDWILSCSKENKVYHEYRRKNGERLIPGYSSAGASMDAHNREKGIERLRKSYNSGVLKKEHINKQGYNKFLRLENEVAVILDQSKIDADKLWDGLEGCITNTELPAWEVIEQYHGLWVVERAFRISKGNLETRPVFNFTERRIEAHICICFIAYKVYKELERLVALSKTGMSVDKVIAVARTITAIRINMPLNNRVRTQTLFLTDEQKAIKMLFDSVCDLGDA
jgi:transposase